MCEQSYSRFDAIVKDEIFDEMIKLKPKKNGFHSFRQYFHAYRKRCITLTNEVATAKMIHYSTVILLEN